MTDLNPKFGFVVIVDALGARTHSIEESIKYIESVNMLKEQISTSFDAAKIAHQESRPNISINDLRPRYFGDTILFTLQIDSESVLLDNLFAISFMLNVLIETGISEQILFRGAFSIGNYIETDDIVLGPAVVDAANWYEKIELIAIMATPQARNYLKSNLLKNGENTGTKSLMLVEYNVPNKNNSSLSTYVFNWPYLTYSDVKKPKTNEPIENQFYSNFKQFFIPPTALEKYSNTEKFFIHCIQHVKKIFDPESA